MGADTSVLAERATGQSRVLPASSPLWARSPFARRRADPGTGASSGAVGVSGDTGEMTNWPRGRASPPRERRMMMKLRSIELALPGADAHQWMIDIWGCAMRADGDTHYLRGSGTFPYLVALSENADRFVRSTTFVFGRAPRLHRARSPRAA
jgi:hypothetical protein